AGRLEAPVRQVLPEASAASAAASALGPPGYNKVKIKIVAHCTFRVGIHHKQ
ncbi:hypothetical protein HaLaN_26416, partial [Haematococcus lacustris]